MEEENRKKTMHGRYLPTGRPGGSRVFRWMRVALLVVWDGVLLYMIAQYLIVPVYGAVFVGVISIYLGLEL